MRVLLINAAEPEETRVAVVEDQRLEDYRSERTASASIAGNVYLGEVVNLERGIEAAFVELGSGRNGFLHVSDCRGVKPGEAARIEDHTAVGAKLVVQVTRESIGAKGPVLTTNISLPGRFLVLLPFAEAGGVSRRIEGSDERDKLKSLARELEKREGMGLILRTAAAGRSKRDLLRDLRALKRLWSSIEMHSADDAPPGLLYAESDLVVRALRDMLDPSIEEIVVDTPEVLRSACETLRAIQPEMEQRVRLPRSGKPLFHEYSVEKQVDRLNARRVSLPSGGSVVFDLTEALVAVDVNTGRAREEEGFEETAYKTNLEAAEEIARQIRLRNLGGVIAVDFIDLRESEHVREVERTFRAALRSDRAHVRPGRMGAFGIFVLTRRRVGPPAAGNRRNCSRCGGSGQIPAPEDVALRVFRELVARAVVGGRGGLVARLGLEAAAELEERRRGALHALREETGRVIRVEADPALPADAWRIERTS